MTDCYTCGSKRSSDSKAPFAQRWWYCPPCFDAILKGQLDPRPPQEADPEMQPLTKEIEEAQRLRKKEDLQEVKE